VSALNALIQESVAAARAAAKPKVKQTPQQQRRQQQQQHSAPVQPQQQQQSNGGGSGRGSDDVSRTSSDGGGRSPVAASSSDPKRRIDFTAAAAGMEGDASTSTPRLSLSRLRSAGRSSFDAESDAGRGGDPRLGGLTLNALLQSHRVFAAMGRSDEFAARIRRERQLQLRADLAGGLLIPSTPLTLNRRAGSARMCTHTP